MPIIRDVYLPTPGDKGGPPRTDAPARDEVGRIMDNSLSAMAKQFEYETMRSNLDRLRTGATPQDQKDTMALGKFLLELVESERSARQAAEKAKGAAEQERWKVEADQLHKMGEEIKATMAQQGSKASSDPIATLTSMMGFLTQFDAWKAKQGAGLPREATATADGPTLITLQQMKQAHEEKMEELRATREQASMQFQQTLQVTLEQMRQAHEVAMEEARDRRDQMKIQLAALQQREGQKGSQFREMIDIIGSGVKEIVARGPDGDEGDALVEPRVSRQPIGRTKQSKLAVYHCDECGADVPISPEVEKLGRFTCGGCGVQYEIEKGGSNGARGPNQGNTEGAGQPGPGGEAA